MSSFHAALVWAPVALVVALLMEPWAALLHGRVWHRGLWRVHRSHHQPRAGHFEANDALSILHAPIAVGAILYGCLAAPGWGREVAYGLGIGMTAFGVAYVVVHDGLVHERLPVAVLLQSRYLRAVVRAHRVHHARCGGPPYGLFLGPLDVRPRHRLSSPDPRATAPSRGRDSTARAHRGRARA